MPPELLGLSLGFSAGLSPGPLLSLVIRTSLERGFWAGARVALAPLVTDAPIIALCLLMVNSLPSSVAALLGLVGGGFVIYLGLEGIKAARQADLEQPAKINAKTSCVVHWSTSSARTLGCSGWQSVHPL